MQIQVRPPAPRNGPSPSVQSSLVYYRDEKRQSVLHWATRYKELGAFEFLLRSDSAVDQKDNKGATALHLACEADYIDIARALVENVANIEATDN